jgi:hypothetical protein
MEVSTMTTLRYYTVVQGTDGKGQAGAVTVGATLGGLIAVKRVAARHTVGEGDSR